MDPGESQPEPAPQSSELPATGPDAIAPHPVWKRTWRWGAERVSVRAVAVLGVAVGVCAVWVDSRSQIHGLQQELVRKLAEADGYNKESHQTANQARDLVRDLEYRLGVIENRLAETQNQRLAVESLYLELTRNRDERILAEVEQILLIGSQQLQLAGNIKAALIALEAADSRLQRSDSAQFTSVRRAIRRDTERLKSLPYVDVVGMSLRLDALGQVVDGLPLSAYQRPAEEKAAVAKSEESAPVRVAREIWHDVQSLIRIQRSEREEMPLLSPSQSFFVRENLRLRLMSARVALLAHDGDSFKADTRDAVEWLERYFDTSDHKAAQALTTLKQLAASDITVEVPDISSSLEAVRSAKLVRERGLR
jgi:uroporphyrin-III C-methyltransferase